MSHTSPIIDILQQSMLARGHWHDLAIYVDAQHKKTFSASQFEILMFLIVCLLARLMPTVSCLASGPDSQLWQSDFGVIRIPAGQKQRTDWHSTGEPKHLLVRTIRKKVTFCHFDRHRMVQRGIGADVLWPEFCRQNQGWCYKLPKDTGDINR